MLTTVNAALQRVPPRDAVATQSFSAAPGNMLAMDGVTRWLELNGFTRASTVREPGEYAVRGGILDLFRPGMDEPVRLDFFGDTLESIRTFDPETQRTDRQLRALDLVPVAEFQLTTETIRRFRQGYVEAFGAARATTALRGGERRPPLSRHGALAAAVPREARHAVRLCARRAGRARAAGRGCGARAAGADRRLLRGAPAGARRRTTAGTPYKPLPPDRLYLAEAEWRARLDAAALARLTPFAVPDERGVIDIGARARAATSRPSAPRPTANVFDAVTQARRTRCRAPASASSSRCGAKARATA